MQNEQGKSGLQFRADARPANIGWKLAAVGITDLLAMGLRPVQRQPRDSTNTVGITDLLAMGLRRNSFDEASCWKIANVGITDLLAMGLRPANFFAGNRVSPMVGITDLLAMGLRLSMDFLVRFSACLLESQTYLRWD